ncbi:FAD-binding oxidoreductase [Ktedonosporobacter rubrisoli]|uniref:FAD-binding oxidoreductase n=1 Tax=Ktedonosporobacter rubrisoli TaxID=2509675 RepID=A0A4P6JV36_KTERU|nr:FAD-binding oxidoreductase [Ktedonosporobacter rubrisoli]QBD79192.1 FAD-binding oxidoreductase [Ktedonosporobacter rubrisoli]
MVLSKTPQSWGRYPSVKPKQVVPVFWRDELPDLAAFDQPVLPFAYGRSYGDSCLNEGGISLDVSPLRRFLAFDKERGILRCEAGVSLADVLELVVPQGWFLPVTPGTKFVSVGGAIANDVHGKNHHKAGTFGCHVTCFELLRSDGERLVCSPTQNSELFRATIGGLGLTGVILWAEFRLKPITGPFLAMDQIRFSSLDAFKEIADASDETFEYTVAWVDCLASEKELGRGIFMRANNEHSEQYSFKRASRKLPLAVPFDFPSFTLNTLSMKAFNTAYYNAQRSDNVHKIVYYEPFFYPLDAVHNWNRIYGKRGFFQYQCVVPFAHGYETIKEILRRIRRSGEGSFLTVFKKFGTISSPGMLSFPRPGLTLALDFPNNGRKTLRLFESLDGIVRESGGIIYPAKDARMHAEDFQSYFPQWKEFEQYIDPHFSSSFWRRVTIPV